MPGPIVKWIPLVCAVPARPPLRTPTPRHRPDRQLISPTLSVARIQPRSEIQFWAETELWIALLAYFSGIGGRGPLADSPVGRSSLYNKAVRL